MKKYKEQKIGKKLLHWGGSEDEEWDVLTDELTYILKRKNRDGRWSAEVKNFGWQQLNGHKEFEATEGGKFLREILPDCDCHFDVFNFGAGGVAIQNWHHDSPMGTEWYYVTKRKEQ